MELHATTWPDGVVPELWYQPVVRVHGDGPTTVVGAEALLRGRRGDDVVGAAGMLSAHGEQGSVAVDRWVWREAEAQLRRWRGQGLAVEHLAVNVSPRSLEDRVVLSQVLVAGADGPALEVLERGSFSTRSCEQRAQRVLGVAGTSVWLDDVEEGDLDRARVARWPGAGVKLDRSVTSTRGSLVAMLDQVCGAGRAVVVEGVEELWQHEELVAAAARGASVRGQGHLYSMAVPAAEMEELLRATTVPVGQVVVDLVVSAARDDSGTLVG